MKPGRIGILLKIFQLPPKGSVRTMTWYTPGPKRAYHSMTLGVCCNVTWILQAIQYRQEGPSSRYLNFKAGPRLSAKAHDCFHKFGVPFSRCPRQNRALLCWVYSFGIGRLIFGNSQISQTPSNGDQKAFNRGTLPVAGREGGIGSKSTQTDRFGASCNGL